MPTCFHFFFHPLFSHNWIRPCCTALAIILAWRVREFMLKFSWASFDIFAQFGVYAQVFVGLYRHFCSLWSFCSSFRGTLSMSPDFHFFFHPLFSHNSPMFSHLLPLFHPHFSHLPGHFSATFLQVPKKVSCRAASEMCLKCACQVSARCLAGAWKCLKPPENWLNQPVSESCLAKVPEKVPKTASLL